MKLSNLLKTTVRPKKRVGRGQGSGKGKTSTRGQKGQKARETIKLSFEGGQLPLIRRLPFKRGKDRNKPLKPSPLVINLKVLNLLPNNTEISLESLVKLNIVDGDDAKKYGVKILGDGLLEKPLVIKLPVSNKARAKVEKAGGKVEWAKS